MLDLSKYLIRVIFLPFFFTALHAKCIDFDNLVVCPPSDMPKTVYWLDNDKNGNYDFLDYTKEIFDEAFLALSLENLKLPQTVKLKISSKLSSNRLGYTDENKTIYINANISNYQLLKKTISHELMHVFQYQYIKSKDFSNDRWFFEGMAVYFEITLNLTKIEDYEKEFLDYPNIGVVCNDVFNSYKGVLLIEYLIEKYNATFKQMLYLYEIFNDSFKVIETISSKKLSELLYEFYEKYVDDMKKDIWDSYCFGSAIITKDDATLFAFEDDSIIYKKIEADSLYVNLNKNSLVSKTKDTLFTSLDKGWNLLGFDFYTICPKDHKCFQFFNDSYKVVDEIAPFYGVWIYVDEDEDILFENIGKKIDDLKIDLDGRWHMLSNALNKKIEIDSGVFLYKNGWKIEKEIEQNRGFFVR